MKKIIFIPACIATLSAFATVGASAQTTGLAAQNTMKLKDVMKKDDMETTGIANDDMTKGSMKQDGMNKDGMTKNAVSNNGMQTNGTSK